MRIFGGRLQAAAAMLAGVIAVGHDRARRPGGGGPARAGRSGVFDARARNAGTGPDRHTEQVRQIVQCGGTMFAVGKFTAIRQNSVTYPVNNVISFSAAPPYTLTGWAPDVNGTVNSIAFIGGNCADAYLGGKFTSISGTAVRNIAEVDTTTGQVVPTFGSTANAQVETLLGYNSHLIVGGYFTSINNSKADPYLASVAPATGKDDGFIHLGISGHYVYPGVGPTPPGFTTSS